MNTGEEVHLPKEWADIPSSAYSEYSFFQPTGGGNIPEPFHSQMWLMERLAAFPRLLKPDSLLLQQIRQARSYPCSALTLSCVE